MGYATLSLHMHDVMEQGGLLAQYVRGQAMWPRTALSSWKVRAYTTCKRWFMHDCMHKWEKGSEYPNCKYKHERPTKTPEEAPAAVTAQCNATTTRALPTELTLTDLVALKDANKSLQINTTSVCISRDSFWMQPEVDAQLCGS